MRICPNYEVNPIDVAGLYNLEKSLFGVMDNGVLVTPCEYFAVHHWAVADVFAGIFYLCWVPVPILFGLCLYFKKERKTYLRFALVFVCQLNRLCRLLYPSGCSPGMLSTTVSNRY